MTSVTAVSVSRARRLLCAAALLPTTACHVWRVVDAHIVNDSVIGIWAGSSTRIALGVSEVRTVKVRRLSVDRTVMVVLGIAAGTAILAKAISDEKSKPTDICPGGCFSGSIR